MRRLTLALTIACTAALATVILASAVAAAQPKPEFTLGFKALADQISEVVGEPLGNEYLTADGDSLQKTTKGLLVWRKADNWTAFTDGARSWVSGPEGIQARGNDERFPWEATSPVDGGDGLNSGTPWEASRTALSPQTGQLSTLNGRFLMLNMHGALFHQELRDFQENVAYAQWMRAGVIRVFATDSNSFKPWDGKRVGDRIADVAPFLREGNIKLLVTFVNNHQPVPGEAPDSSGWMDGYHQLSAPLLHPELARRLPDLR